MGYFKFLNKLFPKSPDPILKRSTEGNAALAKLAHVNMIINDLSDIAHYELDADATNTININTNKGIIDIINFDAVVPGADWASPVVIVLVNSPVLNINNRDNLYIQITPYYSPTTSDNFIPYVLATGFTDGLNLTIWNANKATAGINNGEGSLYLYYEIKSLV